MRKRNTSVRTNLRNAKVLFGDIPKMTAQDLKHLTNKYALSVAAGDLQLLGGYWYVTHAGLLRVAQRRRCLGITTLVKMGLSDPACSRWVFKATVFKSPESKGFVGYGDADPSNVSSLVHGAEMRVAETRAVNRALRKAYGIGLCSVEELGSFSSPVEPIRAKQNGFHSSAGNGSSNGQPRLRDRLCLLIRQHQLDSNLVKRYAAEFCGTEELREASRDMVEAFIDHLGKWAIEDHAGLLSKLTSYSQVQAVHP
ncbi:MAG: hypothetical protein WAL78_13080 [Candidatus Acidiferrales bacterium]